METFLAVTSRKLVPLASRRHGAGELRNFPLGRTQRRITWTQASTALELESPHLHMRNLSLVFTNHDFPIEEWAFRNTLELTSILSSWREIEGSNCLHSPPPKSFPNHPFLLGESQTCPSWVLLEPSSSSSLYRLKHRSQNLLASNHGSSQLEESTFSFLASGWPGKIDEIQKYIYFSCCNYLHIKATV